MGRFKSECLLKKGRTGEFLDVGWLGLVYKQQWWSRLICVILADATNKFLYVKQLVVLPRLLTMWCAMPDVTILILVVPNTLAPISSTKVFWRIVALVRVVLARVSSNLILNSFVTYCRSSWLTGCRLSCLRLVLPSWSRGSRCGLILPSSLGSAVGFAVIYVVLSVDSLWWVQICVLLPCLASPIVTPTAREASDPLRSLPARCGHCPV